MNLVDLIYLFIREKKVKVTKDSVKRLLITHPNYPSLVAITDLCTLYSLKSRAVVISASQLKNLIFPAIAHFSVGEGQFVSIKKVKENYVYYLTENGKKIKETITEFEKKWDQIIFMADLNPLYEEVNYINLKIKGYLNSVKYIFPFVLYFIIIISALWTSADLLYNLKTFFLITAGALTGLALIRTEFPITPNQKFNMCAISPTLDCTAVLNSRFSKIFGEVTFSHVVFVYFWGQFIIYCILLSISPVRVISSIFLFISIIAIPFTILSIIYQSFFLKKYCLYCITICLIIWLQCGLYLPRFSLSPLAFPTASLICILLIGYGVPFSALIVVSPLIHRYGELKLAHYEFSEQRKDKRILKLLLEDEEKVDIEILNGEIILGAPDGSYLITIILNLYCLSCGETFQIMEYLLVKYPKDVRVLIRYVTHSDSPNDKNNIIANNLLKLSYTESHQKYCQAIHDWYVLKNIGLWSKRYGLSNSTENDPLLRYQNNWIQKRKIMYTPSVFINGKKKPESLLMDELDAIILNNL